MMLLSAQLRWPANRNASTASTVRPLRRSLFTEYFATLFVAVVVPLILAAVSETWFGYRDQRVHLNRLLQAETQSEIGRAHV
jgi:adenylate cyclase